jgi:hypothetical protein
MHNYRSDSERSSATSTAVLLRRRLLFPPRFPLAATAYLQPEKTKTEEKYL